MTATPRRGGRDGTLTVMSAGRHGQNLPESVCLSPSPRPRGRDVRVNPQTAPDTPLPPRDPTERAPPSSPCRRQTDPGPTLSLGRASVETEGV